jgi:hypothetical protein
MDFSLTTLFVLPTGSIAADGFKRENLKPTQFGIFNSRYKAVTTAGEARKSPHIVFGQGRVENLPGLTHKYSDKVSAGSLIEWYKTTASPTAKNQITYAGFDGVDNDKTISVGYDEQVSLTIRARSLYIDTAFAYGLTRTVTVTTPCGVDCGDNCDKVDPRWVANKFAEGINNEPFLSKYVVATPVFECEVAPDAPTTIATATYEVSFCDNGDAAALADVQSQFPDYDVVRTSREGSISTYQMEILASEGAPDDVVISKPVKLAVCDTCPTGYTLVGEQAQYIIETPLDGSEDLNSAADQQTFANTIAALYAPAETFDGATAVDPGTNQITVTAHGWADGQPVVYNDGGGTAITATPAMADGGVFYVNVVDANTITLSATPGGAVVDITADGVGAAHTLTPQYTATFLENKGGSAIILLSVSALATELTAIAADIVTALENVDATCQPPAGTEYTWTAVDAGYKVQRTLSLTLTDDCSSDSTLAELQALYPDATVTLAESANCVSRYELVQTSESTHEDCDNFPVPPKFVLVQPYRGLDWEVKEASLTGSSCVAGVKIEGKSLDKYGNPCDPIAFPHEFDKLTFEVFAYKGAPTSQDFITFDRCDNIPITTTQRSTFATGSGEEIFMLEKRYNSEQSTGVGKHIYHNATWNGGFVRYSDPNKFYDTYVLKFASPDLNTWDAVSRQDETVIIAVPAGEGGDIEAFLLGYFGAEKFTAGVLSQSV